MRSKSQHDFHNHVWKHNSFMGMAKMMQANSQVIAKASSVSAIAQGIAMDIEALAKKLDSALRAERIDPK